MQLEYTLKNNTPIPSPSGIRLVAIDLDGTLFNSRKELPAGAAEVFKAAHRAGLLVSIVTGRNAYTVREVGRRLRLSGPHASSGGALVYGNRGRPVYSRHTLSNEDIRLAVNISRRWNLATFLQNTNRILMENADRYLDLISQPGYFCIPQACEDILDELHFKPLKVTLYGDQPALMNALADLKLCNGRFHITSAGEEGIELTHFGVNKGSALREISTVTGIPFQKVLAIGDSPNDLSMFQHAGLAVAMENAVPEVKQAAAVTAPSNDEGGVLWAIQNLALSTLPFQ